MQELKISVITVCYNAEATIERTIRSVLNQTYPNIEYLVIDGASSDKTPLIVDKYKARINVVVSEPDKGIYDAMNKGIALATGDVIGFLNADDVFVDESVVVDIAGAFSRGKTDGIYGDLNYLRPDNSLYRRWLSGSYRHGLFSKGWMPPHPTFYCRRKFYQALGGYDTSFGSAADYELMLRFIHSHKLTVAYINKVLINMFIGGVSNNSYRERIKVLFLDLKAMRKNALKMPLMALFLKRVSKLRQFF